MQSGVSLSFFFCWGMHASIHSREMHVKAWDVRVAPSGAGGIVAEDDIGVTRGALPLL